MRELRLENAAELAARGRLARQALPRKTLGVFTPVDRDPVQMVLRRDRGRLKSLVPLRHERMAASRFAFFRGSAGLMAYDLAHQDGTDVQVVICGDAHINNFGLYASPERRLVFDLNDFDEAAPGPWEWDVKRMLTSVYLAGEEKGFTDEELQAFVLAAAQSYRNSLGELLSMQALERHYVSVDESEMFAALKDSSAKALRRQTRKARRRDSDRTIADLMEPDRLGFIRFKDDPPILTHGHKESRLHAKSVFKAYRDSTLPEIGYLLDNYHVTDVAMRVVGVGSVGTRCYLIALTGPEGGGLVLQAKEAGESVVTYFSDENATTPKTLTPEMPDGERVVIHQRILQAVSDSFLGHVVFRGVSYYVRQYRDAKGSFDTTRMSPTEFGLYVQLCGRMLARAHSQSPMAHWIGGYIGGSDAFDKAMLAWSTAYAKQTAKDYEAFLTAIKDGRVSMFSETETEDTAATTAAQADPPTSETISMKDVH